MCIHVDLFMRLEEQEEKRRKEQVYFIRLSLAYLFFNFKKPKTRMFVKQNSFTRAKRQQNNKRMNSQIGKEKIAGMVGMK